MQVDRKVKRSEKEQHLFVWFLLAFLVGLGLRLWRLGSMRFTLAEAQIAQNAWQMAIGKATELPGNMSYAGLSALLFTLFEPSFLFARLMPALFGSSLILVPWFWRDRIGKTAALLLAIGLAIDPILLSFSRQIVTPIFVVAGLAWAATALKYKRPVLTGALLALAFLGGYSFWMVALIGLVAYLVLPKNETQSVDLTPFRSKSFLLPFLTSFAISLAVISSAFLLHTEGLGGIAAGLVDFVHTFANAYELLVYQPIIIAIAYSILPLIFSFWSLMDDLRAKQPIRNLPFLIGWGLSLLLCVLLGRQDLGMLVFAAVFAWLGAATHIASIIDTKPEAREVVFGVMVFQVVILGYLQMVSRRLISVPSNTQDFRFAALAVLAGILLLVITTILVGMGWSREVSRQAFQKSLLIMLIVLTLGLGLRSITSQQDSTTLSLLAGPILLPNNDVESIVDEIDREGRADKSEITYDLGDLEQQFSWFFRNQVDWKSTQSVLQADLMLSASAQDFSAADTYRGRNVELFRRIDQQVVKPVDFLKTLLGEPLPMVSQIGVLWVRLNLFTGAN